MVRSNAAHSYLFSVPIQFDSNLHFYACVMKNVTYRGYTYIQWNWGINVDLILNFKNEFVVLNDGLN